jgi:hypothetical protein
MVARPHVNLPPTLIPIALYTPFTYSRCRGIYPAMGGWEVKVKHLRRIHRIGKYRDPLKALDVLTSWYRERFGPYWQQIASARESNPWKIIKSRHRPGVYVLVAWLFGQPHIVEPQGGGYGWPSFESAKKDAEESIRLFVARELRRRGILGRAKPDYPVLWRCVGNPPPDPEPGSVWWAPLNLAGSRCVSRR